MEEARVFYPIDILNALNKANEERHGSQQAYINADSLADTVLDGKFNLIRIAQFLNGADGDEGDERA